MANSMRTSAFQPGPREGNYVLGQKIDPWPALVLNQNAQLKSHNRRSGSQKNQTLRPGQAIQLPDPTLLMWITTGAIT